MKFPFLILCVLFLTAINVNGQLIVNGDLETGNENLATAPTYWVIVSGTPDHCESDVNYGDCGILTYKIPVASPQGGKWERFFRASNYNEVFGQQLSSPLIAGSRYIVSFYCAYSKGASVFTATPASVIVGFSFGLPSAVGQFHQDTATLTSEDTWAYHSYSFIAADNYDFISFGMLEDNTNDACYVDDVKMELKEEIIIEMPNVFTPNNDGLNDNFYPKKINDIKHATLIIYNRWGQKIFETI